MGFNGEWVVRQKHFRNKTTGEIVTQFLVSDIANFEEVQNVVSE